MPSHAQKSLRWLLFGWLTASAAQAEVYPLPPAGTDVIGEVKVIYANKEDTLLDIARRHSLGYDEMVQANPGVDRWTPGYGTPIVLPTRYILPDTPREGIVLNIAEMRLYYYPKTNAGEQAVVHTYPVSIGRMDWKTPLGATKIVAKEKDPVWRPPASIKAEHAANGDILPDVVPSGPDNPLGLYAIRLTIPGYLIHGTDKPFGIGMRVTHGCVRMYPEDIEHLFGMVPIGLPVRLVDQPVKVGRFNGQLLMEAHAPLEEDDLPIKLTLEQAHKVVTAKTGPDMPGVDPNAVELAVEQFSGIPVSISTIVTRQTAEPTYPAPQAALPDPPPVRRPLPPYPATAYSNPALPRYPATAPALPSRSAAPYAGEEEGESQAPYPYPARPSAASYRPTAPTYSTPAYTPPPAASYRPAAPTYSTPAYTPPASPPIARPVLRTTSPEPPPLSSSKRTTPQ